MAQEEGATHAELVPDVDLIERLSLSESQADKARAAREIGAVVSRYLGPKTDMAKDEAITTVVSAALGTNMLPGMPILNGMIAEILSLKKKRF